METEAPGATLAKQNDSGAPPSLGAKLASALSAVLSAEMISAIISMRGQLALEGNLMRGRQIWFEVYTHFRISEAEGSILDFCDLMKVKLNNGQLIMFLNNWGRVVGARHRRITSWSRCSIIMPLAHNLCATARSRMMPRPEHP